MEPDLRPDLGGDETDTVEEQAVRQGGEQEPKPAEKRELVNDCMSK